MRFVDSNVFVYHMAQDPRYGNVATSILNRIEDGGQAATSTLVISQVCSYLKWRKRPEIIESFLTFLRSIPNLMKVDTTYLDFAQAQEIRTEHEIDWSSWDDIVIAAQMKRLRIQEIYSNDKDFDAIPGIKRVFK
ncbi:MAG: type II toxin-antitoxin system VapC family toxin [Candidatus Bathyarchaeia archaeon]